MVTLPREKGRSCHMSMPRSLWVHVGKHFVLELEINHNVLRVTTVEEQLSYWG